MPDTENKTIYTREKDAIAFLGLLAYMYANWDPPIATGPSLNDVTHYHGLNICGLLVDNTDGEVLAIDRNSIHEFGSPVEHGEQRTIRTAIARILRKRPRHEDETVEQYYRARMFYAAGDTEDDYLYSGCSLYSSLEPCPMCTATICVCRMKRTIYYFEDQTYGGSWNWRGQAGQNGIKDKYYASYDLAYNRLDCSGDIPGVAQDAADFYRSIMEVVGADATAPNTLRAKGVYDTLFFDHLHPQLQMIHRRFTALSSSDLITSGQNKERNMRTLADLKTCCNIPFAG